MKRIKEFKIGQKVKIREWEDMEKEFGITHTGSIDCKYRFTERMKSICGDEIEVTSESLCNDIEGISKVVYKNFNISVDMVELVEEIDLTKLGGDVDMIKLEDIKAKQDELKEMIEKFEKQEQEKVVEEKKGSGWVNRKTISGADTYYYIEDNGDIDNYTFDGDSTDEEFIEIANAFTSEEKAEEIDFQQTLFRKLKRFSDEHGGQDIDWKDGESKYKITYDFEDGVLKIDHNSIFNNCGVVYFTTYAIAKEALETFKEDLEKYFGVE